MGVKIMTINDSNNTPQIVSIRNINDVSFNKIVPFIGDFNKNDILTYFLDNPNHIDITNEEKEIKWCNVAYWECRIIFNDVHKNDMIQLVSKFNSMEQLYRNLCKSTLYKNVDIYTTIPEYTRQLADLSLIKGTCSFEKGTLHPYDG